MRSMIAVMTCPRAGVDYFPATLAALDAAGARDCTIKAVFADGDAPVPYPLGWSVEVSYPRMGPRLVLWRVFEMANNIDVDTLIVCQDDITPCRNAVRRMLAVEVPDGCDFITYHDQQDVPPGAAPGLYEFETGMRGGLRGFSGALALVLPRCTFARLATVDPLSVFRDQRRGDVYHAADQVLGAYCRRFAVHIPRLVRHDGEVSAAHPGRGLEGSRATIEFPGEDFDALGLP